MYQNKNSTNNYHHNRKRNTQNNDNKRKLTPEEYAKRKQQRFERMLEKFLNDPSSNSAQASSREYFGKSKEMKRRKAHVRRTKGEL